MPSHLATKVFRKYAPLLVLQAVCASEERGMCGSRISGRELLLLILILKVLTCSFDGLLIGRAKGEHEVGRLLLTTCRLPRLFRQLGRKFLMDGGTDAKSVRRIILCVFRGFLQLLLLFFGEEEILGAAGTVCARFFIEVIGFL